MIRANGHSIQGLRNLRQDYMAVRDDRYSRSMDGLPYLGAGADYHYRIPVDYYRMIEIARDHRRNDPIIGNGIRRLGSNVIQTGFTPQPRTGSQDLDFELTRRWKEWADNPDACDIAGRLTFSQMERQAFDAIVTDGDIFAVRLDSGHLRWYEAHRVKTPAEKASRSSNVIHGVQLNQFRRPVQYWFTREDVDTTYRVEKIDEMARVMASDGSGIPKVLHLSMPSRMSQTRGVTMLAPISSYIGMLDDLQFAKLVQAQAVSAYAIFKKREAELPSAPDLGSRNPTESDYSLGFQRTFELFGPGQIYEGLPGEDLQGFSPNVPNPEFFQHAMLILTVIAVNIDVPVCVLLLDASQTNFSGFRGAVDQARQRYRQMQQDLASQLHRPVWRWQVSRWLSDIDDSLIESAADPYGVEWVTPKWPYLEPLKDAQADVLLLKANLNSPRRIQAAQNRRWDEVYMEIVEDNAMLVEAAIERVLEIRGKYPDLENPPDWREIASLPLPDGITISIDRERDDQPTGEPSRP